MHNRHLPCENRAYVYIKGHLHLHFTAFCRPTKRHIWKHQIIALNVNSFQYLYGLKSVQLGFVYCVRWNILCLSDLLWFLFAMITSSRRLLYFNYSKLTWQAFKIDCVYNMHNTNYTHTRTHTLHQMNEKTMIRFVISEIRHFLSFLLFFAIYILFPLLFSRLTLCAFSTPLQYGILRHSGRREKIKKIKRNKVQSRNILENAF